MYHCAAKEPHWGAYHCSLIYLEQCKPCSMYQQGIEPYNKPHYPVPVLADTVMVIALTHLNGEIDKYAWDRIWRKREELGYLR